MPPSCARLLPVSMRLFGAASGASLRRDVGAVGAVVLCGGASTLPGAFVQRGPSPGVSPIEGVATNVLDRAPLSPAFASRAASTAAAIKDRVAFLKMPKLSHEMTSGRVAHWKVAHGDFVPANAVVAEVETDNLVPPGEKVGKLAGVSRLQVELADEGYVGRLLVEEGQHVEVGQPILVLAESDDAAKDAMRMDPEDLAGLARVTSHTASAKEVLWQAYLQDNGSGEKGGGEGRVLGVLVMYVAPGIPTGACWQSQRPPLSPRPPSQRTQGGRARPACDEAAEQARAGFVTRSGYSATDVGRRQDEAFDSTRYLNGHVWGTTPGHSPTLGQDWRTMAAPAKGRNPPNIPDEGYSISDTIHVEGEDKGEGTAEGGGDASKQTRQP